MTVRPGNMVAAVACAIWFGLFLMGRGLTLGIYDQGPDISPNAGQIDFYIVVPLTMAFVLALLAWIANWAKRGFAILGYTGLFSLFALLPFVLFYSGGV